MKQHIQNTHRDQLKIVSVTRWKHRKAYAIIYAIDIFLTLKR